MKFAHEALSDQSPQMRAGFAIAVVGMTPPGPGGMENGPVSEAHHHDDCRHCPISQTINEFIEEHRIDQLSCV
jgi:hypothetical protein